MGKKRRRRSRQSSNAAIFWIFGIFFALCLAGVVIWLVLKKPSKGSDVASADDNVKAAPELKKVRDELDRKDPAWRLRELAANQRRLSDAKNGAKIVLSLHNQVPEHVLTNIVDNSGRMQLFPQPIPDHQVNQLRASLQQCGQSVAEARKLHAYPDGAYWIDWNFKRPIDTLLPHDNAARAVSPLLLADALVRASAGDGEGAAQSANALINLAHYQRDAPVLIDQLVRIVIRQQAINALERAMTCAQLPDDLLLLIQQSLEAEALTSGLRAALRGERGSTDQWAISVAKGEETWGRLRVSDDDVAWCLKTYNAMIDLAEKPYLKHTREWDSIVDGVMGANNEIKNIVPAVNKVNYKLGRSDAQIQAAAIAVAAERYRRAKGDWPTNLNQLAPTFMKTMPLDKYTGEPFRMARVNGGFAVYSLAKGAFDFQGSFMSIGFSDHEGIGFRMVDANMRR
jgi:hypothetical protein